MTTDCPHCRLPLATPDAACQSIYCAGHRTFAAEYDAKRAKAADEAKQPSTPRQSGEQGAGHGSKKPGKPVGDGPTLF